MKKNIHPENYRTVLFYDSSADEGWLIRSCAPVSKTMVWRDGQEYPVFMLETSSASHPAYTGKRREHNKEGRASRFNQRYAGMMNALKKG
ncbi:MAG: type B 50S ribosomal protein L31 [Neisseria sp.]|uniref:type B 50S ribosomal protein L31 n=1 Tax=Neisseria sp. TaxID=192066 RepID=UPI0026DCBBA6|nr:type B 50S ribosomal protein L31 [Neisseria sp.]MDO4641081.1 type B 50S ribosomal protein L31 [Neisseria sp.]